MKRTDYAFYGLLGATLLTFMYLLGFVFFHTPTAQAAAGGLAQKIFYFHVPAAYAMYLSGVVCFLASSIFLLKQDTADFGQIASPVRFFTSKFWIAAAALTGIAVVVRVPFGPAVANSVLGFCSLAAIIRLLWLLRREAVNAIAEAGAECAVAFGFVVLISGPLWAKKAWGVYWTWDPRLTVSLLTVMIYLAIVVLRGFAGEGNSEKKFAAALGVLGTVNLPIIHYAVQKWGGTHPAVITRGGGGLRHPDMTHALLVGFLAMTLLAAVLLWWRSLEGINRARLRAVEERSLEFE